MSELHHSPPPTPCPTPVQFIDELLLPDQDAHHSFTLEPARPESAVLSDFTFSRPASPDLNTIVVCRTPRALSPAEFAYYKDLFYHPTQSSRRHSIPLQYTHLTPPQPAVLRNRSVSYSSF